MVEIREATREDIPAIARVHVKADWDTYAPLFGPQAYILTIAESEDRWRRALDGGGLLLVAIDRRVVVGLGHACADRIDALYLLSAYHRQGMGRAMFRRLLHFLREGGVTEARFDVVAVNDAAIAFSPGGPLREQRPTRGHRGLDFCRSDCSGWSPPVP